MPPPPTITTLPAPMDFDLVAPTEQPQTDPAAARGTIPHNHHSSNNSNNNMHNDDQLQEAAAGRTRTTKTPADRLRLKQARAERNRASAERSRIKKRLTSHAVSEKVTHLESENTLLKDRVQQLATVLRSLQRIVNPE
jgi:Basic region leucine zipper